VLAEDAIRAAVADLKAKRAARDQGMAQAATVK
jgi:hypothetical protein